MINIHFIINPIAGVGKNSFSKQFLQRYFEVDKYTISIKPTSFKGHAIELTMESIDEQADIIVACGGDGTINEIASCLVNTSISLGILAIGSGNGLASNLKIPKDISKALNLIKKENIKQIDVGQFNDKYFFSNAGIGFDAKVVKHYEISGKRKLSSYIKASIKSLKEYKYENLVEVTSNNKTILIRHFMIFVSNSNEMGYNVSLTPKASLQDGLLDILLVSKLSRLKTLLFGFLMLLKKQRLLSEVESFQTKKIQLIRQEGSQFNSQIDGEFHSLEDKKISISILEKSLKVIA